MGTNWQNTMVLLPIFLQILFTFKISVALPQNINSNVCADLGEYSCVKQSQCWVDVCDSNSNEITTGDGLITEIFGTRSLVDDIFGEDVQISLVDDIFGEDVLDPDYENSGGGGENTFCSKSGTPRQSKDCTANPPPKKKKFTSPRASDEFDKEICCHKDDLLPEVEVDENVTKQCSDFDGYACQPVHNCHGHLIASSPDYSKATVRSGILEISLST